MKFAASELENLERSLMQAIAGAPDEAALEEVRIAALGKKGRITELLRSLGGLSHDELQLRSPALNGLRVRVSVAIKARAYQLERIAMERRLTDERLDITLPVRPEPTGRIHPLSQVYDEVVQIFGAMGFAVAEGPEIETDDYNFTLLNIPPAHPSRQMHDTFYFPPKPDGSRLLLRTHTSPVQIRTMLREKPPIRIIAPGRVYRCDSDQTHTPQFHQLEALVIDEETHMGHLKWCVEEFCRAFFEVPQVKMRFRPSHFPFTEPSAEVDIQCDRSGGEIKFGQGEDWLEILGSGVVHPNVLRNCGIDPDHYRGFAFGMGLDRLAMLKYGIPDLRAFFESDLRWLRHYGFAALDVPTLATGLSL
jgi:phenylalanyl-tRNA synthetase alpha chain